MGRKAKFCASRGSEQWQEAKIYVEISVAFLLDVNSEHPGLVKVSLPTAGGATG